MAQTASTSKSTVSRYLNGGSVSTKTAAAVERASFLMARSLPLP
ncbi:MAG: LacI family DNA-binding transcriptional regulator [Oscillospiraceae bacterium]|nr:LacI family DNA-binding transcriptional regulator [Oscillospiraceae bacterium]